MTIAQPGHEMPELQLRSFADDPPRFEGEQDNFVADTCAPLREAGDAGEIGLWAHGRAAYPGKRIENDVLPQLSSVGLWETNDHLDWGLAWHRNEGIEVTVVTAGSLKFSCEDDDFDLAPGHVTITRPWQLHRVGRPNLSPSTLTWFILDVEVRRPNQEWSWPDWLPIPRADLARLTELLRHNERPVWVATKELLTAVGALQRTLRLELSQPMARIGTSVAEIFIELLDLLEDQQPILDPYLSYTERTVRMYLSQLADRLDEPLSVEQMAFECGLGRTRFVHYCKLATNASPLEFVARLRLARATELLGSTRYKIADIAAMCGYQSGQYFSTVFKKHHRVSPAAFRESLTPKRCR